jgi:hypothetical protein
VSVNAVGVQWVWTQWVWTQWVCEHPVGVWTQWVWTQWVWCRSGADALGWRCSVATTYRRNSGSARAGYKTESQQHRSSLNRLLFSSTGPGGNSDHQSGLENRRAWPSDIDPHAPQRKQSHDLPHTSYLGRAAVAFYRQLLSGLLGVVISIR